MKPGITTVILLSFVFVKVCDCSCHQKPNILFIVADDLGWADLSWNDPDIISPNLEQLYTNSIKLQNYYVYPRCTPSRASLLTGYHAHSMGLQHRVFKAQHPAYLPLNVSTFPETLKNHGYKTVGVGKWHLGFCDVKVTPTERGFDRFYGAWLGSGDHYTHRKYYNGNAGLDFRDNLDVVTDQGGVYSTHSYSNKAEEIIRQHDVTTPLYMYLSYLGVHHPLQVPDEYITRYNGQLTGDRLKKAAMVTAMDEGIGNVTKALEDRGMLDNTIVIFTSDNGGQIQYGGLNSPYRGSKGTLYEGGTKAVGFIHGSMFTESDFNGLFHIADWYPTLLSATGYSQSQTHLDGIDQWNALLQNQEPRQELVYNINEVVGRAAIRNLQYKLLIGKQGIYDAWYSATVDKTTRKTSKLASIPKIPGFPVRGDGNERVMLFDLLNDPTEQNDLSADLPEVVDELYARLQTYEAGIVPANVPASDPAADPANFDGVWSYGWCEAQ